MKKTLALMLIMVFMATQCFGAAGFESGDTGSLGNNQWRLRVDGDLEPNVDSTYDIGQSGNEVANIYIDALTLGGVEVTSLGSVTGAWTDGGLTTYVTSAPAKFIATHSTGGLACTGFTAGTGDIALENAQTIDGGTNNSIILGDNSDTLDIAFDGDDVSLTNSDGSIELIPETSAADGTIDFFAAGDVDDYIQLTTTTNQPLLNFVGCNGKITAATGTIDFDNEILTTTGTVSAGATTVTSLIIGDDTVDVVVDDQLRFASNDEESTIEAYGYEAKDGVLQLTADEGDDAGDKIQLVSDQATNSLLFTSDTSVKDTHATILTLAKTGLITTTGDVVVAGTTPTVTIGDAGAEDTKIVFDNNTQDYYVGIDDTGGLGENDFIVAGLGSAVGTTPIISLSTDSEVTISGALNVVADMKITGTTPTLTVGDAGTEDTSVVFDGNATDFYIGLDDTDDDLKIGYGSAVGTTSVITIAGTLDGNSIAIGTDLTSDGTNLYWKGAIMND